MASQHFENLEASLRELKRIYLDDSLHLPVPSADQQERARGFLILAHAEFEYFIESSLKSLSECVFNNAKSGTYSAASLALMTFSGLPPLNGGDSLGVKKASARSVTTRLGEANKLYLALVEANSGTSEKYLTKLGVPLGLHADLVDNTWLSDLDAFCSSRGAFAHMSRTTQRASHLGANPADIWTKCERLTWTNNTLAKPGIVTSFQSLDDWVEKQKNGFQPMIQYHAAQLGLWRFFLNVVTERLKWLKLR